VNIFLIIINIYIRLFE